MATRLSYGATHSLTGTDTSGAAYLFDVTTGQQLLKFAAPSKFAVGFGWSVALNSTTALVGARNENAAYLFDLETGQMLKKLTGPTRSSQFGASVAINDNFAVIGAVRRTTRALPTCLTSRGQQSQSKDLTP